MFAVFRCLFLCCVFVLIASPVFPQEFRATVTGRIVDPDGLAVPGVTVNVTNAGTNEVASAVTNTEGVYSLPFLRPGTYSISAELEGFRRHTQENIALQVGQTQTLNITLQVGLLTEVVTVTGEAPLLETANADRGMIIDNLRVTELPLNARNPFMLSYLSPGITYNGPAIYQRPFDNGAIADWSINGGQNRNNEFLLDGAPNNSIQGGNNIAYVPPVDAVQEFKIVTNSYDAQYGRTAGGVINVSLKSGTNSMHGSIYEFARRKAFDSNEYFFKLNNREKPNHKLDQYGFQIDGPVRIPGMYDGRNRTFFMFNYEGYKELTPNPATYTVPDRGAVERRLQQPARFAGTAHHDLRPEHRAARKRAVGERPVPRESDPRKSHPFHGADAAAVFSAAQPAGACGRRQRGATISCSRRTWRPTTSTTSRRRSTRTSARPRACSSAMRTTSGRKRATRTA